MRIQTNKWVTLLCGCGLLLCSTAKSYAIECEQAPLEELFESHDIIFMGIKTRGMPWQNRQEAPSEEAPSQKNILINHTMVVIDYQILKVWKGLDGPPWEKLDEPPKTVLIALDHSMVFKPEMLRKWHPLNKLYNFYQPEEPKPEVVFADYGPMGSGINTNIIAGICSSSLAQDYEKQLDNMVNAKGGH